MFTGGMKESYSDEVALVQPYFGDYAWIASTAPFFCPIWQKQIRDREPRLRIVSFLGDDAFSGEKTQAKRFRKRARGEAPPRQNTLRQVNIVGWSFSAFMAMLEFLYTARTPRDLSMQQMMEARPASLPACLYKS